MNKLTKILTAFAIGLKDEPPRYTFDELIEIFEKDLLDWIDKEIIGEPIVPIMPRAPGTKEQWDAYLQARAKMILQDEMRKKLGR